MRQGWLGIVLVAAACADEIPEDVSARMEAARAARDTAADSAAVPDLEELLVNAPPGGHADWVREIRTGLDSVAPRAASDRGEALYGLQEIYSRRFEALRRFYGADGAAGPVPAVARAVEDAGEQLRELMRHLASTDADSTVIAASIQSSRDALQRVEDAARAAGMPPSAPRDSVITTS
jgi:hypothetical protein